MKGKVFPGISEAASKAGDQMKRLKRPRSARTLDASIRNTAARVHGLEKVKGRLEKNLFFALLPFGGMAPKGYRKLKKTLKVRLIAESHEQEAEREGK